MRARRDVAGRHTLGSLPETQEPADSIPAPCLFPPGDAGGDLEPSHTIYGQQWRAARERVQDADPATRRLLVAMLDTIERGWLAARELQCWYENDAARALETDDYGQLLSFVDGDVIDLYRSVAGGVAEMVPGWEGWELECDPSGVDGEIDEFTRYLTLLRLAVQADGVPDGFRALVVSVSERLAGWGDELSALVAAWASEMERRDASVRD